MPKENWRVMNPVTFFRKFESRNVLCYQCSNRSKDIKIFKTGK